MGGPSSFSYPSGEPPTPTKTPTSPNFFLNSLQTPKQDARFHGPGSPWSPPFASAASPLFKNPTRLSFATPTRSPTKVSVDQNAEADQIIHAQISGPETSPSLRQAQKTGQSTITSTLSLAPETKRRRLNDSGKSITPVKTTGDKEANSSMNSAESMQTPPPTSSSASRRKAQQAQVARMVKESAEKGRRVSFPTTVNMDNFEHQTSQVEESPQHFSALQFSPDGLQFPMSGPATAPAYPQHKLFWDPEQNEAMNLDFPMDDTFTAFGMQKSTDPFVSGHEDGVLQFPTSPAFNALGNKAEGLAPYSSSLNENPTTRTTSSVTMTRKTSRGNGVDPSLLFSSPGRAVEAPGMPSTSQVIQDDNLVPYAHQLRDAQMELEMQISRKPKRKRRPETESPAVKAALETLRDDRANVRRDIIDDIVAPTGAQRPSSRTSSGHSRDSHVTRQNATQSERSGSRLKASRNALPQHKRTSVTLTIDASGRATTEAKILADDGRPSGIPMEVDSDGGNDSSSSSSDEQMVMSQSQSFAYPQKSKQPKLGSFKTNAQSHSQKSSYASTLGSMSNGRTLSETASRRPSSNLFLQTNAPNRQSRASFNVSGAEGAESEAETVIDSGDDKGDAQSALKKVLQSRQKQSLQRAGSQNLRPDRQSTYPPLLNAPPHPYYISDTFTPSRNGYNQPYDNTSPTTITDPDLATPSSGRSNLSGDSVRCLCHGSGDDGQLMIQW